jgi:hypothetical protein
MRPRSIVLGSRRFSTPPIGPFYFPRSRDVSPDCHLNCRAQLQIDDSAFGAYRDCVGPVLGLQFGEDVPDMALHGFFGER